MLVADSLAFAYPGQAPYGFTFEAAAGDVTAISGASGSGKSTLLDLVAGFQRPSSGMLTLDGTDLLPLPPETRPVSLLLQSDNLFEHLTAAENAALGLPKHVEKQEGKTDVAAALGEVDLAEFADKPASTLSGG